MLIISQVIYEVIIYFKKWALGVRNSFTKKMYPVHFKTIKLSQLIGFLSQ